MINNSFVNIKKNKKLLPIYITSIMLLALLIIIPTMYYRYNNAHADGNNVRIFCSSIIDDGSLNTSDIHFRGESNEFYGNDDITNVQWYLETSSNVYEEYNGVIEKNKHYKVSLRWNVADYDSGGISKFSLTDVNSLFVYDTANTSGENQRAEIHINAENDMDYADINFMIYTSHDDARNNMPEIVDFYLYHCTYEDENIKHFSDIYSTITTTDTRLGNIEQSMIKITDFNNLEIDYEDETSIDYFANYILAPNPHSACLYASCDKDRMMCNYNYAKEIEDGNVIFRKNDLIRFNNKILFYDSDSKLISQARIKDINDVQIYDANDNCLSIPFYEIVDDNYKAHIDNVYYPEIKIGDDYTNFVIEGKTNYTVSCIVLGGKHTKEEYLKNQRELLRCNVLESEMLLYADDYLEGIDEYYTAIDSSNLDKAIEVASRKFDSKHYWLDIDDYYYKFTDGKDYTLVFYPQQFYPLASTDTIQILDPYVLNITPKNPRDMDLNIYNLHRGDKLKEFIEHNDNTGWSDIFLNNAFSNISNGLEEDVEYWSDYSDKILYNEEYHDCDIDSDIEIKEDTKLHFLLDMIAPYYETLDDEEGWIDVFAIPTSLKLNNGYTNYESDFKNANLTKNDALLDVRDAIIDLNKSYVDYDEEENNQIKNLLSTLKNTYTTYTVEDKERVLAYVTLDFSNNSPTPGGGGGSSRKKKSTEDKKELIVVAPKPNRVVEEVKVITKGNTNVKVIDNKNGTYSYEKQNEDCNVIIKYKPRDIKLQIGSNIAYVDDKEYTIDAKPEIKNDYAMLPIRFIAENLESNVSWDKVNRKVTIKNDETNIEIVITIGSNIALVNNKEIKLDSIAYINESNDRTYLPIRFVSEQLGSVVDWIKEERKVDITYDFNK